MINKLGHEPSSRDDGLKSIVWEYLIPLNEDEVNIELVGSH
jgi:hypothetical protein